MAKLFLASRSSLSCTVLVLDHNGPARALRSVWQPKEGEPLPLAWGSSATECLHLAEALACEALSVSPPGPFRSLKALADRLYDCRHDVWIMTQAEVLAGLEVVPYSDR